MRFNAGVSVESAFGFFWLIKPKLARRDHFDAERFQQFRDFAQFSYVMAGEDDLGFGKLAHLRTYRR